MGDLNDETENEVRQRKKSDDDSKTGNT